MALLRVEYSSRVLEMNTSFQVFLPDEGKLSETRVVYLLHGLTGGVPAGPGTPPVSVMPGNGVLPL